MRPQAKAQVAAYVWAVARSHPYGCVPETAFAADVPQLPDPDDRHVVAAAAGGGARWVLTYNLKDFPADALASTGLEPISPDDFLMTLFERDGALVAQVMRKLVADKRRPPRTMAGELGGLRRNGLGRFAGAMERALG